MPAVRAITAARKSTFTRICTFLTFHNGIVATSVKENPHGTVTATVYLVPLTTDRHRQAFSTVCVEKLVKTGNIVVSVRPDQGGINIAEQELI